MLERFVNLHGHLEGSTAHLLLLDEAVRVGMTDQQILDALPYTQGLLSLPRENRTPGNFFPRLRTGAFRAISAGALIGPTDVAEANMAQRRYLGDQVKNNYVREEKQGVTGKVLLVCPFNTDSHYGGDLSSSKLLNLVKPNHSHYSLFKQLKHLHDEEGPVRGISWSDYMRLVRNSYNEYRSEALRTLSRNPVETLIFCSFRREKDFVGRSQKEIEELANECQRMYIAGVIDGVDICGDESDKRYAIPELSIFLNKLTELKVRFTIHGGEVSFSQRKLGNDNIRSATSLYPDNLLAVTHYYSASYSPVLLRMLAQPEHQFAALICLTSNVATGVAREIDDSNLITQLMKQTIDGVPLLLHNDTSLGVGDDDPNVPDPLDRNGSPVPNEYTRIADHAYKTHKSQSHRRPKYSKRFIHKKVIDKSKEQFLRMQLQSAQGRIELMESDKDKTQESMNLDTRKRVFAVAKR